MKLTPKKAAEYASVSPQLIYRWTSIEKRLPHYRAGGAGTRGRILIDQADLDAFLATLKVGAAEKPALPPRPKQLALKHLSLP